MPMHPTATPEPYIGLRQLVTVKPQFRGRLLGDGIYRVVDVPGGRRKSYLVEHVVTGAQVIVRGGHHFEAYTGPAPAPTPPLPTLVVGTAVTCEPGHRIPAGRLMVVLGRKADGAVKLVLLGGEGDRYWPSVPAVLADRD